jgi:hypothetical protein
MFKGELIGRNIWVKMAIPFNIEKWMGAVSGASPKKASARPCNLLCDIIEFPMQDAQTTAMLSIHKIS